ncbi:Hypothetical protein PHPALM_8863 [Phytophthora palmivora]|uniref:Uncharacterized protein n=1 Tax=Phytophthora palmivora TaxID=4796 RepID=A0A2P4Y8T2_9STRA|nr:Hypothetical protein PHPALM_8863 [Phytophthora palmivora]
MLLLLQNGIGEIVGRRLSSSKNKEETMWLLSDVKFQLQSDDERKYLVSDNARAMYEFMATDPFHLHQRFAKHIKSKSLRKHIRKEVMNTLYDVDRGFREPEEMKKNSLRKVLSRISVIEMGSYNRLIILTEKVVDLLFEIVSISQLEGFHIAMKKLLAREVRIELGLYILDVFIVQHNIDVGARFGNGVVARTPEQ